MIYRILFTSLFFAFLKPSMAYSQKKLIEVYLIAGQSNATGQGYIANMDDSMRIDKCVLIFHSGSPHLESVRHPLPWLSLHQASESPDRFGTELQKLRANSKIALIKHAHSAINLYQQWNPGANNLNTSNQGSQ